MGKLFLLPLLFFFSITISCRDTKYIHEDRDETTPGAWFPMSINGNGFFIIRDQETGEQLFSKMGNFYLSLSDNLYYLVDPYGNSVQGWNTDINGNISGSITNIVFSTESEPMESGKISVITNLDRDRGTNSPILSSEWDGTATPPISSSAYEYESIINVYDIYGVTHEITIYSENLTSGK